MGFLEHRDFSAKPRIILGKLGLLIICWETHIILALCKFARSFALIFFFFFFFFLPFLLCLGLQVQYTEVSGLGVKAELQLPAYPTSKGMQLRLQLTPEFMATLDA